MPRATVPRPTDAELEILRVLWTRGPSTVRDVHEELSRRRVTGYTTVLKLLQIMTEKGLTQRDERERAHVYEARLPQRQLVGDLMDRAFGGSAARLVMQALSGGTASAKDLSDIRRLIDELEEEGR